MLKLNEDNYYSKEADIDYMSVSQLKNFLPIAPAKKPCEARAVAELNGEYIRPQTDALTIGSYIDTKLTGTQEEFEAFKEAHPEIISSRGATKGELKANFKIADEMVERAWKDRENGGIFLKALDGEKQKIFIGEIFGFPFKAKLDCLGDGYITDLKTTESINKRYYANGWYNFIDFWGYTFQGAIYQELVYQNTGKKLPFYIAAISKENNPDLGLFQIPQENLDIAMTYIDKDKLQRVQDLKNGTIAPQRCENCDYCRATKVIKAPVDYNTIGDKNNE